MSVDFGTVGIDGEWTAFIGDVADPMDDELVSVLNDGACQTMGEYEIDSSLWWAQLLDSWMSAFPDKSLVGKILYGPNAISGSGAIRQCYVPNEYVVGRRGSGFQLPSSDYGALPEPTDGYTGRKNGVRWDSWMGVEVLDRYWDLGEADYMQFSGAWDEVAYHGESWNKFEDLLSENRDTSAFGPVSGSDAYGYWDFEEAIRFSIARHVSVFNPKNAFYVPWLGNGMTGYDPANPPPPSQRLDPDEPPCDCSPNQDGPCVAEGFERLLTETGFRLRRLARALDTTQVSGASFPLVLFFSNAGNAPAPESTYELEVGFVEVDASFDPTIGARFDLYATFPRRSRGPRFGANLATRIVDAQVPLWQGSPIDAHYFAPWVQQSPYAEAVYDSTNSCDTKQNDVSISLESAGVGGASADVWVYPFEPGIQVGALAQRLGGTAGELGAGLARRVAPTITAPSVPGEYAILYRFNDIRHGADGLPMEQPHGVRVGDGSTARWYFASYLTVVP
jgi:hypothetical protein